MDGLIFRLSQANSIGIRACTLHALRNLFQHYTSVSSFSGVLLGLKLAKLLNLQVEKIFENPGTAKKRRPEVDAARRRRAPRAALVRGAYRRL